MPDRIRCCVPFCRRTYRNDEGYSEWICRKHWLNVPKQRRRVYARVRRMLKRHQCAWDARSDRLWSRLKKTAIERSVGL